MSGVRLVVPKTQKLIPNTTAVTPGQTAQWKLPIGPTYENLYIVHDGNCTLAEMTGIRLRLNGQVVRNYASGTDLNMFNVHDGFATDAGTMLRLPLVRNNLMTQVARELTGLATGNGDPRKNPNVVTDAYLEIDVDAGAAGAALTVYAEISGPRPPSPIVWVRRRQFAISGSGEHDVHDSPFVRGDYINKHLFKHANLTEFKLEIDGQTHWEAPVGLNNILLDDHERTSQAGVLAFDPTFKGQGNQAIATAKIDDYRFKLTSSAADTVTEYVESVGPLVQIKKA